MAQSDIFESIQKVPARPVGIVFGARVHPGGVLSSVLRARVDAAIALYRAGKVQKLLMTGDNSRVDYDEVTAMKQYAVKEGVPARDIVRDFAGFRTFDSCYRARVIFQVRQAILISQGYHLSRAIYLARHVGIDAVGLVAELGVPDDTLARLEARESLASARAVVEAAIPGRKPHFLGRVEPIFGDDRTDR